LKVLCDSPDGVTACARRGVATMMYYDNGDGWGWLLMTVTMVVLLGAVILTGIVVYRHTRAGTTAPDPIRTDEPSRILAERFARGEIDETEYLDRLSRLRAHDQI
jgi:putative membrane protein